MLGVKSLEEILLYPAFKVFQRFQACNDVWSVIPCSSPFPLAQGAGTLTHVL